MSSSDVHAKDVTDSAPAPGAAERGQFAMLGLLSDALCGVDGTTSAYEAVAQAAALAGPEGHLALLSVIALSGSGSAGSYHVHTIEPSRASLALEHAKVLAAKAGVPAESELEPHGTPVKVVLKHAAQHRLLALGAPSMSRFAHLLLGGVATEAAHELPCSLLIARRPAQGHRFDERILVASDAGERSDGLVAFAGELARARGASVLLLHAAGAESAHHPTRIAAQAERLRAALGEEPTVEVAPGRAHSAIVEAAAAQGVSLIVMASRRVSGVRALGSVSERVVHDAPCSVLVLRPEDLPRAEDPDASLLASAERDG